jgi:hypothetical protein
MLASITETAPFSSDPACNTGLICQSTNFSARIDSFNFVAPVSGLSQAKEILDFAIKSFNDDYQLCLDSPVTYGRRFEASVRSVSGVRGGYNPPTGDSPGEVYLQIKGKTLARMPQLEVVLVIAYLLHEYSARFTRLDLALDDYDKMIEPRLILDAIAAGDCAHFRNHSYYESHTRFGTGWTLGFGTRGSPRYLRYYNKQVESKGQVDAYRWELELHDELAREYSQMLADCLCEDFESLASQLISKTVLGAVDFVDRASGDRLSRCSRLDWWQKFLDLVEGGLRLSLSAPTRTLEKTLSWIDRQVQTSLAMIADFLGRSSFDRWVEDQLRNGRKRYDAFHERIISVARSESAYLEPESL